MKVWDDANGGRLEIKWLLIQDDWDYELNENLWWKHLRLDGSWESLEILKSKVWFQSSSNPRSKGCENYENWRIAEFLRSTWTTCDW